MVNFSSSKPVSSFLFLHPALFCPLLDNTPKAVTAPVHRYKAHSALLLLLKWNIWTTVEVPRSFLTNVWNSWSHPGVWCATGGQVWCICHETLSAWGGSPRLQPWHCCICFVCDRERKKKHQSQNSRFFGSPPCLTWNSPPSSSPVVWWSSVSSTHSYLPQTPQGWRSSLWGWCLALWLPVSCNPGSPCRWSTEWGQDEKCYCSVHVAEHCSSQKQFYERAPPACRCCAPSRVWRAGHSQWQKQQRVQVWAWCQTGPWCLLEDVEMI